MKETIYQSENTFIKEKNRKNTNIFSYFFKLFCCFSEDKLDNNTLQINNKRRDTLPIKSMRLELDKFQDINKVVELNLENTEQSVSISNYITPNIYRLKDLKEIYQNFPKNKLFQLFDEGDKYSIFAKLKEKRFVLQEKISIVKQVSFSLSSWKLKNESRNQHCLLIDEGKKPTRKYYNNRFNLFSLMDDGIKLNTENWKVVIPELISKHIAKNCEGLNIIVDAFCGVGGNTIQLAKIFYKVIAIDNKLKELQYNKHNAKIYHVENKIEYIQADFLTLKKMNCDLVFLHPHYTKSKNFSIFVDIQPNIIETCSKSFEFAKNVIIILPKFTNLKEIPILISKIKFNEKFEKESVMIESIFINDHLEYYVLYFGSINKINKIEEIKLIEDILNKEHCDVNVESFLRFLIKKIGFSNTIKLFLKIPHNKITEEYQTNLQCFIDVLKNNKLLSNDEILEIMNHTYKFKKLRNDSCKFKKGISKLLEIETNFDKKFWNSSKIEMKINHLISGNCENKLSEKKISIENDVFYESKINSLVEAESYFSEYSNLMTNSAQKEFLHSFNSTEEDYKRKKIKKTTTINHRDRISNSLKN